MCFHDCAVENRTYGMTFRHFTMQTAQRFATDNPDHPHLAYWLYLPADFTETRTERWPLVLFLHGKGERGADLDQVKAIGLAAVLDRRDDLPFIAVSPQCPAHTDWTPHLPALDALVTAMLAAYPIDPDRVYLTGLSMGSRAAWEMVYTHPQRYAALAAICGRIPDVPEFLAKLCVLKDLPIWIFHGVQDTVVPVENSHKLAAALQACDGNVQLTLYPDARHDSWTAAYADPALVPWLLAQRRPHT